MTVTSSRQKLALVSFGVLLTLCLLEAGLRVGGWLFLAVQEARNRASLGQGETYRILCIGESTTAFGGDQSYPSWLERILNERARGVSFSVVNKGIPSVTSDVLVRELEANLDRYRPHLVVAMMGINDPVTPIAREPGAGSDAFDSLRTWKLLRLLFQSVRAAVAARGDPRIRERRRLEARLAGNPADAEALVDLGRLQALQGELDAAEATIKRAIGIDPDNAPAYNELAGVYAARGDPHATLDAIRRGLTHHPAWNARKLAALRDGRAAMRRTRRSYHEVLRLVRTRGLRLVAVQYPLRSADLLRAMLEPAPDVLVVDNEHVFKDALGGAPYTRYFGDRFAGDFGHTTPEGSRLLASNVARVILKELFGQ